MKIACRKMSRGSALLSIVTALVIPSMAASGMSHEEPAQKPARVAKSDAKTPAPSSTKTPEAEEVASN